jgi:hypothetical protein
LFFAIDSSRSEALFSCAGAFRGVGSEVVWPLVATTKLRRQSGRIEAEIRLFIIFYAVDIAAVIATDV